VFVGGGEGSSFEKEVDGEGFSRVCGLSFFENAARRFPKDRRSGLRALDLNIVLRDSPSRPWVGLGAVEPVRDSNLLMSSFVDLFLCSGGQSKVCGRGLVDCVLVRD